MYTSNCRTAVCNPDGKETEVIDCSRISPKGMVVWVRAQAAGMPNDQRARVERIDGQKIHVIFLGDDSPGIVFPGELCGLEITDNLTIKFTVDQTERSYRSP